MFRHIAAVSSLLVFTVSVLAQAPLTINGIVDRATYTDTVSFSVPVVPGYSYAVTLDGARVPAVVPNVVNKVDYHEVTVWRTNMANGTLANGTVRFIVQASTRGSPEKGLIVWTPYPPVPSAASEFAGAQLHIIVPRDYPLGLDIPVAAWVDDSNDHIVRGNGSISAPGFETAAFRLVRGHGSGFLPAQTAAGALDYLATIASLTCSNRINLETGTSWITASGTLAADTTWPTDSRIALAADLTIPAGVTLTIGAGSIVKINPLVDIINSGTLIINGTLAQPVVLTPITRPAPERNTGAWGGIIMRGGRLVANGAILTGGGGATSFDFSPGSSHRSEQALLLVHSGSNASLTNCFLLNQAGQMMNGYNSDITLDHCLLQRAITSGESVGGTIIINHSAIIEFPSIDGVYNAAIADADYDAIYFTTGTHILKDSLIGFSKDDAIDSGSGGAGTVLVTNCWIESALHEALAWSGGGRQTWTYDSVNVNCGQGIEAGWTEGSADRSPDCFAERLLTTANSVGARFGDNYDWTYYGRLRMTNSLILHNYRDVYAKTWNTSGSSWNTNQWIDRLAQMDLRGNYFTTADSRFPANFTWDALADAARIAPFMTTPTNAPVGVGFAVWATSLAMSTILDGVPVRLSSFTAHPVSVDYTFSSAAGTLSAGKLNFAPGETLKRVFPAGFSLQDLSEIHVTLSNAEGGEITGFSDVVFMGTTAAPVASLAVATQQLPMERLGEGIPVRLSTPAAHTVSVPYRFTGSGDIELSAGTLAFDPGETLKWIDPPSAASTQYGILRFDVSGVSGASFTGPSTLMFVATDLAEQPAPTTLISRGAVWRYLDDGSNQGTAWRSPTFQDAAWAAGRAQLGFGDFDENTPINPTNRVTGTTNITFYFRSSFVATNETNFRDLSMWLLRDDGGVVYLNGNEVFRSTNMPLGTILFNTFANNTGENSIDTATLSSTNLTTGTNVAAVEIHQQALTSSDVSFDFELVANPVPAATPTQHLQAGVFQGGLTLGWGDSAYVLEQANAVTGAWSQVTSPSPITVSPTNAQMFFRLRR
ncbi:MAG TPA: hypothetical protein VJA21_27300 [Verrucomicrobiae bacterium]